MSSPSPKNLLSVSAVIIANQNLHNILPTINSLLNFEEIVILFSNKDDETADVIKACLNENQIKQIRFEYRDWQGFGKQKQKAVSLAKNEWIFSVDSDEVLSEELIASFAEINFNDAKNTSFKIRRINYFMNKPLYFGEGGNDYLIRLFNRNTACFSNDEVHEKILINKDSKTVSITGILKHFSAISISEYIKKQKGYGEIAARKLKTNKGVALIKMITNPIIRFIKFFIFKLGFLDGIPGLIHITIGCYASFIKYVKVVCRAD